MSSLFSNLSLASILLWAAKLLILFGSIILHEVSHGYLAYLMGDPTAKFSGRLSLNPLKHVDPMGTILIPAVMLIMSGGSFSFGYAKPVPINPRNFKDERQGMLVTGIAGPLSNIALAFIAGILTRFLSAVPTTEGSFLYVVVALLYYATMINLVLAFFNLIPIPPLDGSRVVQRFLPNAARNTYHALEPYGFVIVIALSFFAPQVFNAYFDYTAIPLLKLLTGIA